MKVYFFSDAYIKDSRHYIRAQYKKCGRCSAERLRSGHNIPSTFLTPKDMHPGKELIVPITKIYLNNGGGISLRGHEINWPNRSEVPVSEFQPGFFG